MVSLPSITIAQGIGFGIITMIMNYLPWSSIFLITQLFGIRLYTISRKEECQNIQKKIGQRFSHIREDGKGSGYSIGKWYFLCMNITHSYETDTYDTWMISTESSYEFLTKEKDIHITTNNIKNAPEKSLKILQRYGNYHGPYYKSRSLQICVSPLKTQDNIIKNIINTYNKNSHCITLLYGSPGSGKSMLALLLANAIGGSYCNTFIPWQPGDTISSLYSEADPSPTNPIVIAFDEIDTALVKINEGINPHKSIPIQISNKTGWNNMLDEIQRGLYPHLIIIMTTNKNPEFINNLDPSYLREGRVDIICELDNRRPIV